MPVMEKMLANGYETGLVDAPDFTTGVKVLVAHHLMTNSSRLFVRSPLELPGKPSGRATGTRRPAPARPSSSDQTASGTASRPRAEWSKLAWTSTSICSVLLYLNFHPPGRRCGRSQGLTSSCGSGQSPATS